MKASRFTLVQFAVLNIAFGAGTPPPLPNKNFGVTGEQTKFDTAFGNLGELGPIYNLPEALNDSTATSGGNAELSTTKEPITQTTERTKIVQLTTVGTTEIPINPNVVSTSTVKTTGEVIALLGSVNVNGTTSSKEETFYTSTLLNPAQTFETTTVSKENPKSNTESGINITSETINIIKTETTSTGAPSNNTPPSTTSSVTSSAQGNNIQSTPQGPTSQNFHTGSPNWTNTPTILPGRQNETKPGQNSTIPSKPNSSFSLHPNIVLTLTVSTMFYIMNIK